MKLNKKMKAVPRCTHEGARASHISALQELERSVMSCMLWEDTFYENGEDIAARIQGLVQKVSVEDAHNLAIRARKESKLRHVPLWIAVGLASRPNNGLATLIPQIVQRADEMGELLAMYWKGGRKPLPAQMKKGLAACFDKFDAYQFAKYANKGAISIRDVMFLVHPTPWVQEQEALFKKIANDELVQTNTWEAKLSAGEDKKAIFSELLAEGKLGYMALLRNLRNMEQSDVDRKLVSNAIIARKGADKVLPFRFVSAAKHAPSYTRELDQALQVSVGEAEQFDGSTIILVDTSGSMYWTKVSAKSDMTRVEAAGALAAVFPGNARVICFGSSTKEVKNYRGLALVDQIIETDLGGTLLGEAVRKAETYNPDRLIVVTDEQSNDKVSATTKQKRYMINVSTYENGISYNNGWNRIDGWSENVFNWMREFENERTS